MNAWKYEYDGWTVYCHFVAVWTFALLQLSLSNVLCFLLFISIFLPVFIKDQYEVSYEKKDLFSLSTVSSLLNFIPSPLFALSWIKHYHINDVIHKAHAELYFFVSRRSSYFDSACIALFMMVVGFAHAPCGWFCLNYKLLVKYEVTNMI